MDAFLAQSNDGLGIILKFELEFANEDWRTNCKLRNADYGRVFARLNDGLGIILKFVLDLQLKTGEPIVS